MSTLLGAPGATPGEFSGNLASDVVTVVDNVPTIFSDLGQATFRLEMKDPINTAPTPNNFITLNRYHVRFFRADGRNTPGVDVPHAFDGSFTLTVTGGDASAGFVLVRLQAKGEAPLAALARNFAIISTIAEVTFYGRDQTGHEVSVTAQMSVDFGNFGDPN